jgi:CHAT domain-containing protein
MPKHAIAHFTCHGSQDLDDPGQAGLMLDDGVLSIPQIAALDLSGAELAVLSACQTALGGVRLLDEAVHLSAAFQMAGYRHVIGTLWAVTDQTSAGLSADVYDQLSGRTSGDLDVLDTRDTAVAVHHAVRKLRERHRALPLRWIPYVHIGP